MKEYQSFSHTRLDCKFYVLFIPKCRMKLIYGVLRKYLGEIFREITQHRECKVVEGYLMKDYVHIYLSVPQTIQSQMWLGNSKERALYR